MAKRTVTMNWDHLDDFNGDDDEFFESTNRLSVVVPLDMPLPEFDEDDDGQEFNDSRVSFSHNLASISIKEPQNAMVATIPSSNQYDMWMVAPGSITDRRRRLLQGMGLNSNKDFARLTSTNTTKFNKPYSKRLVSIKPSVTTSPVDTSKSKENPIVHSLEKKSSQHLQESKQVEPELQSHAQTKAQPKPHDKTEPQPKPRSQQELEPQPESEANPKLEPEPQSQQQAQAQEHVQAQGQASTQPIFLVRCRSDSDIETSSFNIKRRKEDMIGSVSKQRLTRTSSLVTPSVGLSCQYANVLRVYTPNTKLPKSSLTSANKTKKNADHATSNAQLDSFFLIKNLDTGKEFVVKESNDEGMWNKVSDLQTGKQLTMDEFENTVGHSPVVKELMRRTSRKRNGGINSYLSKSFRHSKKMGSAILKTLKGSMTGSKTEKEKAPEGVTATTTTPAPTTTTTATDTSLSSSSLTREQDKTTAEHTTSTDKNSNSEWVKAKAYGKPSKEFTALHLCQKIQAHDGSIWTMRFSCDGQYLASAGEDRVIHVWEVQECDVKSMRSGDDKSSTTPDNRPPIPDSSATDKKKKVKNTKKKSDAPEYVEVPESMLTTDKKKKVKNNKKKSEAPENLEVPESMLTTDKKKKVKNNKKKSDAPEYVEVPESMFGLSEKPVCTFNGHQDDVLDLSWSRSQLLLSSSMDKTVRLWDIKTKNCLKQFAHSDYVTCIQFNPTDGDYFISGSLDKKVRIWSVPSRKVVNWSDLHDMITAVCYYPDGQGAIVGLHNGTCKTYSTADCKLEQKDEIELHTKAKVDPKKITSFQFSPLNPSEVVITSADSRVRIIDGLHVVEKLIGYKNTSSQFSAQYSADGKYIMCASEDSQVYIWKHEKPKTSGSAKPKYVTTTSYEHFSCIDVTVAVPWHGSNKLQGLVYKPQSKRSGPVHVDDNVQATKPSQPSPVPKKGTENNRNEDSEQTSNTDMSVGESDDGSSQLGNGAAAATNTDIQSTAWGLVIVTAGLEGEIRVYQNVGLPIKVGNLF